MLLLSPLTIIIVLAVISSLNSRLAPLSEEDNTIRKSLSQCIATIGEDNFHHDEIITVSLGPSSKDTKFSETASFDNFLLAELFNKVKWSLLLKQPRNGRPIITPGEGSSGPKGVSLELNGIGRSTAARFKQSHGGSELVRGMLSLIRFRKSDSYVLQLRHWAEIDSHLTCLATSRTWNPHARFIVVTTSLNCTKNKIEYVIKKLWQSDVLNGVILLPDSKEFAKFNIYSWFPYAEGFCGNQFNKVEHIGSCKFGDMADNIDMFPNKLPWKMNNCSVRVRTLEYPPFVVSPKRVENTTMYRINKGLEIQIMNMVSLVANIFMQYEIIKGDSWGEFGRMGNGSSGILGALFRAEADIGIGSFAASYERHLMLDSSSAYFQDSLGFCVPHSKQKSQFEKLSGIMTVSVWISLTLTIIMYVLITRALSLHGHQFEKGVYRQYGSVTMKVLAISIGHAINIQPSSFRVRVFLMMWIIFSLHLDTAYQTYLMSTLTNVEYADQIKTVKHILDSDLIILFRPTDRRYYNAFTQKMTPQANELMSRAVDCDNLDDCLKRTAFQKDSVVAASRLYMQYAKNSYITKAGLPLLYCLEEQIVSYPLVSYMRVGFPLLHKIDDLISRINSGGYIQYFEEELFKEEKMAAHFGNDSTEEIDIDRKQLLTFEHIVPMFFMLLAGYLLGMYAFIAEMVCFKNECSCSSRIIKVKKRGHEVKQKVLHLV